MTPNTTASLADFDSITNLHLNKDKKNIVVIEDKIIHIYIKGIGDTYIEHRLVRTIIPRSTDNTPSNHNLDSWNFDTSYECILNTDGTFTRLHNGNEIINGGAWETAIKEHGADDFIGSHAHGDEILNDFILLLDGVGVDVTAYGKYYVSEITFIQNSNIYRCNTTTLALLMRRWYTIKGADIIIKQHLEFKLDMVIDNAYLTMLPIRRKSPPITGEQITDSGVREEFGTLEDMTLAGSQEGGMEQIMTTKTSYCNIWGKDSKISAYVEVIKMPNPNNTRFFFSKSDDYNKVYFDLGLNVNVSSGDTWETETLFRVTSSKKLNQGE